ncbi:2,3-bisphosphoglycerate-independent phosphoglycerate mutase [Acidihalobacter ferrooxydans]|uniref:2,3-bisphosphoglycerate-independent phosphoglycerate mutase n=1 Tax=Acidihalobacter ferrooxydans TaxID=1765967 RepID=A0A1P8UIG4_9GAMM|nr:2,3-bisphosphoglycerate-independent phosphoglycerate mutase [Acidihalobacter ferrooxydans]APZ43618.1 phosphoglycerate mutase (2,3-diphosphoglycerate-independent) [Acidihalobacter ferrooxydans]
MSAAPVVPRRRSLLVILDGFGLNPSKENNAVFEAHTPRLDAYFSRHAHAALEASGRAVGLPDGQMGNSEVGHLTLGAGQIVRQDLVRIDDAVADGSMASNPALTEAIAAAKSLGRPLHLIGLVSDGGVHSHVRHLHGLVDMCGAAGVVPVVHMITDGRDTAPKSAASYLPELEKHLRAAGGRIATVIGRYYAMDRDKRWDRTELAWRALVKNTGEPADSAQTALDSAYAAGETDEFVRPRLIGGGEAVRGGDVVVFFNFRNDRPRQLAAALGLADFDGFDRGDFTPARITTLTEYDPAYGFPVAFAPDRPDTCLAQVLSEGGYTQFHCAETEKYAHVTFFFNAGSETPFPGEERVVVPSPKVATYDLKPEMSAKEVADEVIKAIESEAFSFIVVNFANGDMVGHTAVREAVLKAVEALDEAVGRVLDAAVANEYSVLLTADHGNCDEMVDPVTGEPHTQHTTYPVPLLLIDSERWRLATGGGLSNIAPTLLELMGVPKPPSMTGRSLLVERMGASDSPAAY